MGKFIRVLDHTLPEIFNGATKEYLKGFLLFSYDEIIYNISKMGYHLHSNLANVAFQMYLPWASVQVS